MEPSRNRRVGVDRSSILVRRRRVVGYISCKAADKRAIDEEPHVRMTIERRIARTLSEYTVDVDGSTWTCLSTLHLKNDAWNIPVKDIDTLCGSLSPGWN